MISYVPIDEHERRRARNSVYGSVNQSFLK
jgi:hypothetical protein